MTARAREGETFEGRSEPWPVQEGRFFLCARCGGQGTAPTHRLDCPMDEQNREVAA